ncbi:MAG: methyltransferase [Sphingomonadales bacterium]|nr:methyltransferase [Sphingomonadales bacterium]
MPLSSAKVMKRSRGLRLPRFRFPRTPKGMFFSGFLRNPVMVGSIIPSSDRLIRKMLSRCDWANTRLFVEYGPGVGTFCQPILDKLAPDAMLLVIDTNPDFVAYLKETIHDPRFRAICGSATDVERYVADAGYDHADYIASGLPFSTLPPGIGDEIAAATKRILRVGGAFLVYQYNPSVRNFIARQFDRIDHEMEFWNVPPAQLWWAWKE